MARLVRLAKGSIGPEQIGVAIPPSAFTTDESLEAGKTWEEAGYKLHSYEDDKTPYALTDADKTRIAAAREERAAARAEAVEERAAPAKDAPAKAEKKG